MEDSVSLKSNESVATSDEFDFVCGEKSSASNSKTPTLAIIDGGDLNGLKQALTEVLQESSSVVDDSSCTTIIPATMNINQIVVDMDARKIGQSMFYSSVDGGNIDTSNCVVGISPSEKQDVMKPDCSDEEVSDVDQDCTIFSGVTYLGAATMNAPKSESEVHRNMAILNEQTTDQGIKIAVSIPTSSQGIVVLYDSCTNSVIARYEIHRILFYAHGAPETTENNCFAFTWSHGDPQDVAIFQCHVFRCDIAEAVAKVSACFVKAFQRNMSSRSMTSSITSTADMTSSCTTIPEPKSVVRVFEVSLEIKEDDGKGTYSTVPKDRAGFKFKINTPKQLCLNIKQVSDNGPILHIERYFGVLVGCGRHVKHGDMHLLELLTKTPITTTTITTTSLTPNTLGGANNTITTPNDTTVISATWDPTEPQFAPLNTLTAGTGDGNHGGYMSVAVDLVIQGIQEPVRFQMEAAVRNYPTSERFWYFQKRQLVQHFFLSLKEIAGTETSEVYYEVLSMESSNEIDRNKLNLTLNLPSFIQSPTIPSLDVITPKEEYDSDGDEPLLSGTGQVSKDCSEDVLVSWADVLNRWKQTQQRPKQLSSLVKLGIPEALRGEVWQRLAGVEENLKMMETYRLVISKESSCETVIQRDIARTFPAHDFFKEVGGLGQDSLYRVTKAYAIYDSEVGYCQGLSFLAATLLLHMPEEQAFCVLVRLMYDYGLRDLYKDGFDNLYLRIYQLNRLLEEQLNSVWQHFTAHHVETHMFASQWFLTLYTARFPLCFVFHIIDVFLLYGVDVMFQIALALLTTCKKDLLSLDFEGIMKYIRVTLPKKCRGEESAKQLIKSACSMKVKKLKKYAADFTALQEEADDAETKQSELHGDLARAADDRQLLHGEVAQLKEMLMREVTRADRERERALRGERRVSQLRGRLERVRGVMMVGRKQEEDDDKKGEKDDKKREEDKKSEGNEVRIGEKQQEVVGSEGNQQEVVGSDENQQEVTGSEGKRQQVVLGDGNQQEVAGSDRKQQQVVGSDRKQQEVVGSELMQQQVVESDENQQEVVGSDENHQVVVGSDENLQIVVGIDGKQQQVVGIDHKQQQVVGIGEKRQQVVEIDGKQQQLAGIDRKQSQVVENQQVVAIDRDLQGVVISLNKQTVVDQQVGRIEEINDKTSERQLEKGGEVLDCSKGKVFTTKKLSKSVSTPPKIKTKSKSVDCSAKTRNINSKSPQTSNMEEIKTDLKTIDGTTTIQKSTNKPSKTSLKTKSFSTTDTKSSNMTDQTKSSNITNTESRLSDDDDGDLSLGCARCKLVLEILDEDDSSKVADDVVDGAAVVASSKTMTIEKSDNCDGVSAAAIRVRELELELAQVKLAHVEAQCTNQDLTHQLRSIEQELTTTKNNWPPWLSKTLTSIKEVANKKEFSHFNYSGGNTTGQQPPSSASMATAGNTGPLPTFISHIGGNTGAAGAALVTSRRDSAPMTAGNQVTPPVSSQSCNSLKSQN